MNVKLEALEDRRLLAAVLGPTGTLTINMTDGHDVVTTAFSGGILTVDMSDGTEYSGPVGAILAIVVQCGAGNDNINMVNAGRPVYMFGANGHDTLTGGSGNDTIQGGNGDDRLNGGAGNDRLDGGANSDLLIGSTGSDTIDYSGRSGNVAADLDGGKDDGEAGELDQIDASAESIMGGSGNDTLTGNAFGNYLSGGAGRDLLQGGAGNDVLVGGAGIDSMFGNDGADSIFALDGEVDLVNGGPGSDSAQTDPAEGAPVPGEDTTIPSDPLSTFVGPVYSQQAAVFASRKIVKRPTPASRKPADRPITVSAPQNLAPASPLPGGPVPGGPAPGPGGFGGDEPSEVEEPVTVALLNQLSRQLDPYNFGQVIVTRSFQGNVIIGGTVLSDEYLIQTYGDQEGPAVEITVNGGITQFFLSTRKLNLESPGGDGEDLLTLAGSSKDSGALWEPSAEPGQGTITIDGIALSYGQDRAPMPKLNFTNFDRFSLITPLTQDRIELTGPDAESPAITLVGASDGLLLPAVQLSNITNLHLDTGTNDILGNMQGDDITVRNLGRDGPILSLSPASPRVEGIPPEHLNVMGHLRLGEVSTNFSDEGTLQVELTNPGSVIEFLARTTQLVRLVLGRGTGATLAQGDNTLLVRELKLAPGLRGEGAVLDLADGNLIVDHNGDGETFRMVRDLIINAYNPRDEKHWNFPGITSFQAATDRRTGLGYVESAILLGRDGGHFQGLEVDGTATLVSLTLLGDTNLDKVVDFVDLVALAQNYGRKGTLWHQGDFNYDSVTDFADLVPLAQNYNQELFV